MHEKKPTSVPYRRKGHEAYQHSRAHRLEGVVKNAGVNPVRKPKSKKKELSGKLKREAEHYAEEQLKAPEPLL